MDGVHDMGGMDGFGPVVPELDEPVFHHSWEGRVLAMGRAMGYIGAWNPSMGRFAQERLPPRVYLGVSYYERKVLAMETTLAERGLVCADELAAGHALRPGATLKPMLAPATIASAFRRGATERPARSRPRFHIGTHVRAKNIHPATHTRLPRYIRGHLGVIEIVHGSYPYPDQEALGTESDSQWLYTVVFDGLELWGSGADPSVRVSIDAFEPYLDDPMD